MNEVESWYDDKYDEWSRLDRHRVEFEITKRYFDEYIIGEGLEIFDIGGGPGRYSLYLAEKGHRVTLMDLSKRNIEVAKEKSKEFDIPLVEAYKGNALCLGTMNKKYDVVLLMGPLYHLLKEEDRKTAISEALNVLKDGGVFIAAFISKYAPIQDALGYLELDKDEGAVERLLKYLDDGENRDGNGFTTAYFTGVDEARELMSSFNLQELAFAGVENILGCKEKEILSLTEEEIEKWINIGYALSRDEKVFGTSQHFLYIGKNKNQKRV